jgi:uncharacterized protein YdeI (YjbR/CyaY-like superfamily)
MGDRQTCPFALRWPGVPPAHRDGTGTYEIFPHGTVPDYAAQGDHHAVICESHTNKLGRPTGIVNGSSKLLTMAATLIQLDVRTRGEWRRWLAKHHASSLGVWLLRHKPHTGITSMPYEDLVCEALCFGWVDSLIKRLDENIYAIKVTPRRPTSRWSDLNRKRWKELQAAGLLAAPGLAATPTANRYAPKPKVPELPAYIGRAFKTEPKAWTFFEELSVRNRRDFVVWIHTAKRPETRERRIREAIELLSAGKKLGLK